MIKIVIGGDICPLGEVEKKFIKGDAEGIFHNLLDEIFNADLSIVNLEAPLIIQKTPIKKVGEILGADYRCIKGIVASGWDVLNLANNHILDHGVKGLQNTISTIKNAKLNFIGAGINIKEAQIPLVKEINKQRIIIYAMAEQEFSIADENTPGANPLDLINFMNVVKKYKQQGTLIVLIHGGIEYYQYPSPEMVRRCHFMIDMGADAVIICHSHCPLPWEIYADRPIVYGLGNLIFETNRKEPNTWYEGYLASLIINEKEILLDIIPYIQSRGFIGARKMNENEKRNFFNEMQIKNNQIKDSSFLKDKWVKYCIKQKNIYLPRLFAYNRIMHKIYWVLLSALHSKKDILRALHLVRCESHQEILNEIFRLLNKGSVYPNTDIL